MQNKQLTPTMTQPRYDPNAPLPRFGQTFIVPSAWLIQQLKQMRAGISAGKTRRRKVASMQKFKVTEEEMKREATKRGWKVAQIGNDYVFAPSGYTIRPL